jgi:hypothetical protein
VALHLNKSVSFLSKGNFLVAYYNYNFYFFKKETKQWIESIMNCNKKVVPQDFVDYLKDKKLIV